MKITYIPHPDSYIPSEKAHSIQILKMCDAFLLADSSLELELLVPIRSNKSEISKSINDIKSYYNLTQNFTMKKIYCIDIPYDIKTPKWFTNCFYWLQAISYYLAGTLYVLFSRADVIYTRDIYATILLVMFKSNLYYEAHGYAGSKIGKLLQKILLKKCKGVIAINNSLKEFYADLTPIKNIIIAHDGVGENFMMSCSIKEARSKLNIPMDKKIVMYTGNMYPSKGVNVLVEAASFLPDHCVTYLVGGNPQGVDFQKLRNLIASISNNRIVLVGFVPHLQIPLYLAAADVLVLPTSGKTLISSHYTSPIKLFEYMASKRPIVASDVVSLREVLEHKKNAFLVSPDNPKALAEGIIKLMKNYNMSEELASNAFKDVQNYTWNKRATKILSLIKETLNTSKI